MRPLLLASAAAALCQAVSAVPAGDFIDLVPVPRYLWDPTVTIQKRDESEHPANVTLGSHERMLWSSGEQHNHSTVVSLVTWTPQSQRIIDMAKFSWGLRAARCTEDMMLQFRHNITFQAARLEWEWVNFNSMRSFVMVADHWKCGRDWSPHPWVVSRATYHPHNLTILLHAERSTWKQVTTSYTLDFGEIRLGGGGGGGGGWPLARRQLGVSFGGAFTVDLEAQWPETFFERTWSGAQFTVGCEDCGVEGELEFAGHVQGSVFGGLDKVVLSVTPHGVRAALNLEATLSGFYNFAGKDYATGETELLSIPLPGWRIPGVLAFGPDLRLLGGYELMSMAGQATIAASVAATIPDDSIARLDILGDDRVEVSGWVPSFEVETPTLTDGGISAEGRISGKFAVAVSLEVFDEGEMVADIYAEIPLTIDAEVGHDLLGFCDDGPEPYGVALETDVGAVIGVEAWRELEDGGRETFFDQIIYSDYEIAELPDICISGGEPPEGACIPEMDEPMARWWANEVDPYEEDEEEGATLQKRARRRTRVPDYYNMDCDPRGQSPGQESQWPIMLKTYPKPAEIERRGEAGTVVPIMKVGIHGCDNPDDITVCSPDNWIVTHTTDENELNGVTSWNSEHIYEGNWIREFLDYLQKNYFTGESGCAQVADIFSIGQPGGYAEGMLDSVGNSETYTTMMTLFPRKENGYKFRVFSSDITTIDSGFTDGGYSVHNATCNLGRLVATCKYMEHPETQTRLAASITSMDAVMAQLDQDSSVPAPGDTTYQQAHETWFTAMYEAGIEKLQQQFVTAAQYLVRQDDYDALPQDIRDAVDSLAGADGMAAARDLCAGDFTYP